jgi:hypothetical protein
MAFPPAGGAVTHPLAGASGTVWLCRSNQSADPCTTSRAATTVRGRGATSPFASPAAVGAPRFDCFYVYPTVLTEPGANADLAVQPIEKATAVLQASRFS